MSARERDGARGSALAVALMTLMFLVTLGMAALTVSMSSSLAAKGAARFEQSYYAAESALQFSISRLAAPGSPLAGSGAQLRDVEAFAAGVARDASLFETAGLTAAATSHCKSVPGGVAVTIRAECGGRTVEARLVFSGGSYTVEYYHELEG